MRFILFLLLTLSLYANEAKTILILTDGSKTSISTLSLLLNKYELYGAKFILDKSKKDIDYTIALSHSRENLIIADKNVAKETLKAVRELNVKLIEELFEVKITPTENSKVKISIDKSLAFEKQIEYQLIAIEELLVAFSIKYKKNFEYSHLRDALNSFGFLKINENITLNLDNIKGDLPFFPIDTKSSFKFTNPFGRVIQKYGRFHIYIDTKLVTILFPYYIENSASLKEVEFLIDGEDRLVQMGTIIEARHNFMVKEGDYRVNIIGFKPNVEFKGDESEFIVSMDDLDSSFAVDNDNNHFRVEFYRDKKFLGMVIINFNRIMK